MSEILTLWQGRLLWMIAFAFAFALLARFMPCNPEIRWWKDRRAVFTDLFYWFLVPVVLRYVNILLLMGGAVLLFHGHDEGWLRDFYANGYGPVREWPFWLQVAAYLLVTDVMIYWMHRFFHTRHAWRFHAVHHSSKMLDWMSTYRFHPVNTLVQFGLVDTFALLCGLPPQVIVALVPFNIIYSAMVHANLNWTFGPLRYVFSSPVFHRWHHTAANRGGSSNFAPTFPFIDLLFGTFHMPKGELPSDYGVSDKQFPPGFVDQFFYPFRRKKPKKPPP